MLSFLRCAPLRFWLVFCALGLTLLGAAGVRDLAGATPRPQHRSVLVADLELSELVPAVLEGARTGPAAARGPVQALRRRALAEAAMLAATGHPRLARAHREIARWCTAMLQPAHASQLEWRAEVMARALVALAAGDTTPIPPGSWSGPPAATTTTTIPSALERVQARTVTP